jgi:hypothetical protein
MPTMEERIEAYHELGTEDLLEDLEAGLIVLARRVKADRSPRSLGRALLANRVLGAFSGLAQRIKGEV